jgi:hypothetical protein
MVSASRAAGVDFYKWGLAIEMADGASIRMRTVGQV